MDASEILEKLESVGVEITISGAGDKLRLNPGEAVSAELMAEVKQHKAELIKILNGYHLKYSEPEATDSELAEIKARVDVEGYVLLWSTVLQDLVAFYRGEADKVKIPPGFVPYSLRELKELFGKGSKIPKEELIVIHEAKRQGGTIKDRESHA